MSTAVAERRSPQPRTLGLLVATEMKLAWRYPVGLIFGLGLPVLLLVVFGSIPTLTHPEGQFGGISFFNLYAPTLIVLVLLVLGLLSLPQQMASYREQGVLRRMSTTPVPASYLLGAQLAVNLALAAVGIAVILGVGATIFNLVLSANVGWYILSLLLTVGAMFGLGLCVAAVAGTPQIANGIGAALFYPLAFFSGLYVPLIELHSTLINRISEALPSGAAFDALHASSVGQFPGVEPIGVLVGYFVIFTAAAIRWFRWGIERPRVRRRRVRPMLTRTVTVPGVVRPEEVVEVLRHGLPSRYEVVPETKFKGRLYGAEPAGPDTLLVTTGLTGLWRAQLSVLQRSGQSDLHVKPGGDPVYSALGVARQVRRVLRAHFLDGGVKDVVVPAGD